jgi:hypothetical protein
MSLNVGKEVAALQRMTVRDLRARYAEVFGEETRTGNKVWLVKRIAWRMQSQAEGDLSERARQRAAELANDADVRMSPPKAKLVAAAHAVQTKTATFAVNGDDRLPLPGTLLTRDYKGQTLQVKVLPKGFEFEGEVYKSLSAVAKAITGQHCNGFYFFRLGKENAQ